MRAAPFTVWTSLAQACNDQASCKTLADLTVVLCLTLHRKGVEWEEVDDLKAVAADVDVLYQTRIQKERFLDRLEDFAAARGKYIIDDDLMKILPRESVIMHPLPRVDEVRHQHSKLSVLHIDC